MSAERLSSNSEKHEHTEAMRGHETVVNNEKAAEARSAETQKPDVEAISHRAEAEAKSRKEIKVEEKHEKPKSQHLVSNELKSESLKRSLQKARRGLSLPNKMLSKAVHQPVIDVISKVGANTIARPNGILTGALAALGGSSYILYTAKRYGFEYNYSVVFVIFGVGYLFGLLVDSILFILKRQHRHNKN